MRELKYYELKKINGGGIDPISVLIAMMTFAYIYGKDAAERERRNK